MDFLLFDSMLHTFTVPQRHLLSDNESLENEELRMKNDFNRATKVLWIFGLFATSFMAFCYYIYQRPHDSANGRSLVSHIRRIPFLGWFFRQPKYAIIANDKLINNGDDDENESMLNKTAININDKDGNDISLISMSNKNNTSLQTSSSSSSSQSSSSSSSSSSSPSSGPSSISVTTTTKLSSQMLFGSESITFTLCALALLVSYLIWGFLQERIMGHPYGDSNIEENWFKSSEFCVLTNRFFGLIVAYIAIKIKKTSGHDAPPFYLAMCALTNLMSSWFQYESLHFVTFPVQTVIKSAKILITILMGVLVQRKSYHWSKYFNAIVTGVGVYIFLTAQRAGKTEEKEVGNYFYFGLILVCSYALCDAFTSNWQSQVFADTKISPFEMMLSNNAYTFLVSLGLCIGDIFEILQFMMIHPLIIWHFILMGLCAGFGQIVIFYTIQQFGAVKFATIMTTRMVLSVLISIIYYGHSITFWGLFGMTLTFAALFAQSYDKSESGGKRLK